MQRPGQVIRHHVLDVLGIALEKDRGRGSDSASGIVDQDVQTTLPGGRRFHRGFYLGMDPMVEFQPEGGLAGFSRQLGRRLLGGF